MSQDDLLFGYRLQLLDLAGRIGVAAACRTFGVHRSTYYDWKRKVDRHGLEMLRPRERRRPRMPNQLSPLVEQRIVAFALAYPGFGPRRIAGELRRGTVVATPGIPSNLGASTNEDVAIIVERSNVLLAMRQPAFSVDESTGSGTLTVRIVAYSFVVAIDEESPPASRR